MHLPVQFITMVEVFVTMHAQVLSAKLADDDRVVAFAVGACLAHSLRANEWLKAFVLFCVTGTTLTVPQDSGLPFLEPWCTDTVTEARVDIYVQINQGALLMEVPPYDWRQLS